MESRVSDESIKIDGRVFSSVNNVKLWCVANEVKSCGMFWDLFSSLVVMAPKEQTGKDKAGETYLSQRTQTTTFENDLGASMSHLRPALLFGKKEGQRSWRSCRMALGRATRTLVGLEVQNPTRWL
jgi:hypothetical protein